MKFPKTGFSYNYPPKRKFLGIRKAVYTNAMIQNMVCINEVSSNQEFDVCVWLEFWDFMGNIMEVLELSGNVW